MAFRISSSSLSSAFLLAIIVTFCTNIVNAAAESAPKSDDSKRWAYQNYVDKKWNYDGHLADKKWDYANHLEKKWNYESQLLDKKWDYGSSHLMDKKWNYDNHLAEKKWNYDGHLADKKWDYGNSHLIDKKWNYDNHLAKKKWNYDSQLLDKKWDYANHLEKKWNYDSQLLDKKWDYGNSHLIDKKWNYDNHLAEKKWNYDSQLLDKKWDYGKSHLMDKKWNYDNHLAEKKWDYGKSHLLMDKKWDYTNHLLEKKWDYQDYIMRRADLPANLLFDKRWNYANRLAKRAYPDEDTYPADDENFYDADFLLLDNPPSQAADSSNSKTSLLPRISLKNTTTLKTAAKASAKKSSLLTTPVGPKKNNDDDAAATKCPESTPFKCPSGPCISIQYLCNGVNDCPSGYDEDIRVCTAARRPPVEETMNFLRNMLKNEQGRAFLQLLFGKRLAEGQELEQLGGVKRVATMLAESPTAEDFAANSGMTQPELDRMREVLVATVTGELEKVQAMTGSAVQLKSLEADLKYFLEKLVASHFLE